MTLLYMLLGMLVLQLVLIGKDLNKYLDQIKSFLKNFDIGA